MERTMDPQSERKTKRIRGNVSLPGEKGNFGVTERALTSAQLHINYVTWALHSLVWLIVTDNQM